jgi:hypothetical protein
MRDQAAATEPRNAVGVESADIDCRILRDSAETSTSLSLPDELLALALAQGKTRADAAAVAGVSERTVYTRLADSDFGRRVSDLRAELVNTSVGRLAAAAATAADTLAELLGAAAPPTVRLAAARAVLDLVRLAFDETIAERLSALERQAEAEGKSDEAEDV